MPQYDFRSPGAAIHDALEEQLVKRAALRRQAMLDEITKRQADSQIDDRTAARTAQQAQIDDLAYQREHQQLGQILDDSIPGDAFDPETAGKIRRHGYGGQLREVAGKPADVGYGVLADQQQPAPGTGVLAMAPDPRMLRPATDPQTVARGGSKYMSARMSADEHAAQAQAAQAAKAEDTQLRLDAQEREHQRDREMKELLARMAQSGNAETRALANEMTRLRIDGERSKQETAQTERDRTTAGARQSTQTALDAVNRLLDPNDVGTNIGAATGAYELRGFTQGARDFNAVRDQLVAALALPNLGQLKGPMSDRDVIFVKQLATRLANTRMSDAETRKALLEAQTFLRNKIGSAGMRPAGDLGPDW